MVPKVILHTATSLDGRITGFPADLELYYTLAAVRDNPAMEVPPEHEEMFQPPDGSPYTRPLLVIADSRGRVRCWEAIRKWPYMRDVLALCSTSTPQQYRDYLWEITIGTIVAGDNHIDMHVALEALNQDYGVNTVRVDSGGTLNSVLLQAGVVDEVSVLIHPYLAGGIPDPTMFDPHKAGFTDLQVPLTHVQTEVMGNGIIWLRYFSKENQGRYS